MQGERRRQTSWSFQTAMPTPENLQIVGDIYSAEIIYKSRCATKPLEKIILTTITFDLTIKICIWIQNASISYLEVARVSILPSNSPSSSSSTMLAEYAGLRYSFSTLVETWIFPLGLLFSCFFLFLDIKEMLRNYLQIQMESVGALHRQGDRTEKALPNSFVLFIAVLHIW